MMSSELKIYNTFTKKLEQFSPINPPFVGMYICGPTVYGMPHLGHARGPIVFDVIHRYLVHLGYKVRLVRNITDVGHLVNDADEGEDKIQKLAKVQKLEPMEVAQYYTNQYRENIQKLNLWPPSIEPLASGHIMEQIEVIEKIIENGLAYVSNGSVYFDVITYSKQQKYGELSGRVLEELMAGAGSETRTLEGQEEKQNPNDFALWKKASEEHLMKWKSPWSMGFPGWHIECTAMSHKYLGTYFDIHGGGMDLLFPHHESEIAQGIASCGKQPAKYWLHHNMITVNGQKMAKSLNNGIQIKELFEGKHPLLDKAYSPNTLKFFILMAHYRGTLDFSNEALLAAEKGLQRLLQAINTLDTIKPNISNTYNINSWKEEIYKAINDDFNTPMVIASLFEAVKMINTINDGKAEIDMAQLDLLKSTMNSFIFDILGLMPSEAQSNTNQIDALIQFILNERQEAKINKNFSKSDAIRDFLLENGFEIKDSKEGTTYNIINS